MLKLPSVSPSTLSETISVSEISKGPIKHNWHYNLSILVHQAPPHTPTPCPAGPQDSPRGRAIRKGRGLRVFQAPPTDPVEQDLDLVPVGQIPLSGGRGDQSSSPRLTSDQAPTDSRQYSQDKSPAPVRYSVPFPAFLAFTLCTQSNQPTPPPP